MTDGRDGAIESPRPETKHDMPAEGDDIVVVPGSQKPPSRRRAMYAGGGIVAILAVIAIIAILARHSDTKSPAIQIASPTTVALKPIVGTHPKPVAIPTTTPVTAAPTTVAAPPASVVAPTTPITSPPVTAPHPLVTVGPSALTWSGTTTVVMQTGKTHSFAIAAHNPTASIVALPHPLSCAPHFDGSGICSENVQLIGPHLSAIATITLDATGVAPGHYALKIEGIETVNVTVTA